MRFRIGAACTRSLVVVTLESSGQSKKRDRKDYRIHSNVANKIERALITGPTLTYR
jgi:hypothetical protein